MNDYEVSDVELRRLIKRRAVKLGVNRDGGLLRYCGQLYWVNLIEDKIIPQSEYK